MTDNVEHRWWLKDKTDAQVARSVMESCRFIAERELWRTADLLTSWRLYDGRRWACLRRMGRQRRWRDSADDLMRYNVVCSVGDTITAKLVKNLPAPEFVTNGADYKIRRATKKRNKFVKGALHDSGFYRNMAEFVKSGCVGGTSALKFYVKGKRIECERVLMWELFVPPWEAERGEPRTLYQRSLVERCVLEERFGHGPGKAQKLAAIQQSGPTRTEVTDPSIGAYDRDMDGADLVEVIESWHLGDGDSPGWHAVCVDGGCLERSEYKPRRFPFAFFKWEEPPAGWWGRGLAMRLYGLQYEINSLLQQIQANTKLHASPTTYIDATSMVVEEHLTNEPGNTVKITGGAQAPVRMVAPIMPAEVYAQVQERIRWAFETAGVSQLSASSQKPAGLDASVALRTFHDIESERFIVPGRRVEEATVQAAHVIIDLARTIRGYEVDTMDRKKNRRVKWADLELAEEDFTLQCFPVAMLSQTPAFRRQEIQELIKAGMISPEKGRDLLDFPDLEEDATLTSASLDYVRFQVELILDEEGFEPPEPTVNLSTALPYVNAMYLKERAEGCPEHILEQLRRYRDQMTAMAVSAAEAAAPTPPAAATAPAPGPAMAAA